MPYVTKLAVNEVSVVERAIIREVYEETGILFEIDRMGYIHENFFVLKLTGEVFHELSIYYYMKPIENYLLISESLTEDDIEAVFGVLFDKKDALKR